MNKQKQEAIRRLRKLKAPEIILKNLKDDVVLVSTKNEFKYLDKNLIEEVKKLEENRGHYVYHVIDMDNFVNFLIVAKYEEDWEYESSMLDNNIVYAYVYPKDNRLDEEIGPIGVEVDGDIIVRVS